MKNRKIAAVLSVLLSVCVAAGCGKVIEKVDPNKKLILFSIYDGGYGMDWIADMMEEYNKTSTEYVFSYEGGSKKSPGDAMNEIESGTRYDAYFTADAAVQRGIYNDLFEDLTDVYSRKVDGEDGPTIAEKLLNADALLSSYSKNGEGAYIIPLAAPVFGGLIYDHSYFVQEGFADKAPVSEKAAVEAQGITVNQSGDSLLFASSQGPVNYKEGDVILTAGKDGKYGTYDDGQATTLAGFDALLAKIKSKGVKSFCYSGLYNGANERFVMDYIVQTAGIDTFAALLKFDSGDKKIRLRDGSESAVTLDNAHQVIKQSDALYKALSFVKERFYDSDNLHPGTGGSTSHLDAQNSYLMGFLNIPGNPRSAFLVDGSWWENEARRTMSDIAAEGNPDKEYGKVDYRYYLLPDFEGQKGFDGQSGKGTPMEFNLGDGFYVPKSANSAKIAAIKDFLAFTLKEENLRLFTRLTGVMRPYKYALTTEDRQGMSKFALNVYEMMSDTQNIQIFSQSDYVNMTPMRLASSLSLIGYSFPVFVDGREFTQSVQPLRENFTVDQIMNGLLNYSDADWANAVAKVKQNGFYQAD
jgi:hypothetical protein